MTPERELYTPYLKDSFWVYDCLMHIPGLDPMPAVSGGFASEREAQLAADRDRADNAKKKEVRGTSLTGGMSMIEALEFRHQLALKRKGGGA